MAAKRDYYEVLGIDRNADEARIKSAYRKKAKKYHPDNYDDSNPLKELASDKMREINEAYDEIKKRRAQTGGGESGGYGSPEFAHIRTLITQGRYTEADRFLEMTDVSGRNAEWNYLKGITALKKGWLMDGAEYISRAYRAEPSNPEYKRAYDSINAGFGAPGGRRPAHSTGCSGCDICAGLMCMDCLCNCFR